MLLRDRLMKAGLAARMRRARLARIRKIRPVAGVIAQLRKKLAK